jgi:uncharacterized protein YegJ (DUF2314 family)
MPHEFLQAVLNRMPAHGDQDRPKSGAASMRILAAILALSALAGGVAPGLAQTALEKAQRDEIFKISRGDPDMAAAMRKARDSLPDFFAMMRAPAPSVRGFSVKVGVRDGDEREFFWIAPFRETGGDRFAGEINNTPRSVRNVRRGQTIAFTRDEIVDWLYIDGTRMKGNFTMCPLLKNEPPSQAKAVLDRFGMECAP